MSDGDHEHMHDCCGARHAADRRDELAMLAQMALDHRAMKSLRAVLEKLPRGTGHCLEVQIGLQGEVYVFDRFSNRSTIGPDPESAFNSLARWPR